jgi:pilus assembly protein Flp/PilA
MWTKFMVWANGIVVGLDARDEEGQTLVEYALIIALVAILLIGALTGLKTSIGNVFSDIAGTLG